MGLESSTLPINVTPDSSIDVKGGRVENTPFKGRDIHVDVAYRFIRFLFKRWQKAFAHTTHARIRLLRKSRFKLLRSLVFFGFRLWLRKVHHPEKLPKTGPVLIVSNHVSYFDWAVLASILRNHTIFLGAKELQTRPLVRWLMKLNTLIYIDRDKPGMSYFREVIRQFRQKQMVVVYPEGHRSRSGKRQPARPGFVKLALLTKVPIVPIGMKGTFKILPPNRTLPRFHRCEVYVGDPIFISPESSIFQDLFNFIRDENDLDEAVLQEMAERIMDQIAKMLGPEWDAGVSRKRLLQYKNPERSPKTNRVAAFFDVDRTVVKTSTQKELAIFLYKKGLLDLRSLAKAIGWTMLAKYNLIEDSKAFRESLYHRVFPKLPISEWAGIFDEFVLCEVAPSILREIQRNFINEYKKRRYLIVLVSASIDPVIERLSKIIGADAFICTRLASKGGFYTGKIAGEVLEGSSKARSILEFGKRQNIDLVKSYGFSDGFSDVRWLAKIGYPTIINPDRKLSAFAQRRNWGIIHAKR